ncbi:MAG: putative entry exclusion protein TrbK-alt [Caulobacteraceae bacterium]
MRALTARGWGTIAAVAVLIAVVLAAVATSTRFRAPGPTAPAEAGLDASLRRCRDLGAAAENDPACHETWRRMSDHFLGVDRRTDGHE